MSEKLLTVVDLKVMSAEAARKIGLPAKEHAFYVFTGPDGEHVTGIGEDVEYLRLLVATPPHVRAGMQIPMAKFPLQLNGWPEDWEDNGQHVSEISEVEGTTMMKPNEIDTASAALTELLDQIIAGEIHATSQETAYISGALAAIDQIRSSQ